MSPLLFQRVPCKTALLRFHRRPNKDRAVPKRMFSSKENTVISTTSGSCGSSSSSPSSSTAALLAETEEQTLGSIVRHGSGDACIALNVGGKEFYTLRSTVNSNQVLAEHVARAEANHEITKNGAVFIDRDPEHFGFILKYLRNRIEWMDYYTHSCSSSKNISSFFKNHHFQPTFPKDDKQLRELYVEAAFYRIQELQDKLCESSWLAYLGSMVFGKTSSNPFDAASKLLAQLRTGLLAAGALGGTAAVTLQEEFDWVLKQLGFRNSEKKLIATGSTTSHNVA